jgi:D-alanyl-D-alanine dipeptidase
MKKRIRTALLFVVFLFGKLTFAQADSVAAHYGLDVVSKTKDYLESVLENPDMELVDLAQEIPDIILDIRYATENNFVGTQIYATPRALARKPVANALAKVQAQLDSIGYGLVVFDAYRPYEATVLFFETYADSTFVAHPSKGSRHNRGCAVDLSLVDKRTGKYLEMPTAFDDFSEKASPDYDGLPAKIEQNRELLRRIMEANGFTVYPSEWWHFDFVGWENFPLMDIPFEEL